MRQHVYGELVDSLGQLVAKFGQAVRKVAIWTTGDDVATGYQPAKIARSGIITAFTKAVRVHNGDLAKTEAIIADNKFNELDKYLESQGLTRLVVIEDSRSNLRKVAKIVEIVNEAKTGGNTIEYVPVWAAYSREGIQAKAKGEKEDTFYVIDSPKDLLDDKFGEVFRGADILVDFDGVIGNNITVREAQAQVKYNALVGAVIEREGVTSDQANQRILDNLSKLSVL
ncbi:hypothetical protein A3I48_03620 [Candidatus Daviesbacteria bacterium RIFCSPLOWO2_02_FULL_36_7]|uniref:Uncharacterized protein n=1 Tax=Candidatus Daviesbacteria bacterium RIFCSPLOWO2_02_FULL_36_7 TaxID=1797792 RepID=A0A1F5MG69_9BACT|nr:MAG: hypothetical protein A3I48_03620 [Candidatus Daviesbacteria bacterium RIFCSPLOWO2_02_FULL_36_7]